MYILKQLFFSISVNSGFGNIYLAAFAARQIFCHYSPRFQRIIVNYFTRFTDRAFSQRYCEALCSWHLSKMASKRDESILRFFAKGKCTKCIIFSAVSLYKRLN